jgi:hypothetical protein
MKRACVAILAAAVASVVAVDPAPGYDAWAWLLWGREVAAGGLSTVDGPAFKPLPVAVSAVLAPLGGAAPWAWVLVVRAGAVLSLWLAFRLGRELAGALGGVLAAVAVALTGGFGLQAAVGGEAPLVLAFALGGFELWRAGRVRGALLCGAACALLRVEAWPFLAAAGVVTWRREPGVRPLVAAFAVVIPALWFVPEWIGSGDPLRSGARARVPNPGQPALADVPALASLEAAARIALWPLLLGAALIIRRPLARLVLAAGAAWVALVALMAQAGFSGEPRYALPGVALMSVAAAAGLARGSTSRATRLAAPFPTFTPISGVNVGSPAQRGPSSDVHPPNPGPLTQPPGNGDAPRPRTARSAQPPGNGDAPRPRTARSAWPPGNGDAPRSRTQRGAWRRAAVTAAGIALLAAAAVPRVADLADVRSAQRHQWALARDLDRAVAAAGGPAAVLACGRPYVGPYRGPLMAYALDVTKRTVEPDAAPRPPGVVFRARLTAASAPAPDAEPAFHDVARAGQWQVLARCN